MINGATIIKLIQEKPETKTKYKMLSKTYANPPNIGLFQAKKVIKNNKAQIINPTRLYLPRSAKSKKISQNTITDTDNPRETSLNKLDFILV